MRRLNSKKNITSANICAAAFCFCLWLVGNPCSFDMFSQIVGWCVIFVYIMLAVRFIGLVFELGSFFFVLSVFSLSGKFEISKHFKNAIIFRLKSFKSTSGNVSHVKL